MMLDTTTTDQRVFNNNCRSRLALIVSNDINTPHLLANYLEENDFQSLCLAGPEGFGRINFKFELYVI
jgi:hypothetical protein